MDGAGEGGCLGCRGPTEFREEVPPTQAKGPGKWQECDPTYGQRVIDISPVYSRQRGILSSGQAPPKRALGWEGQVTMMRRSG